MGGARYTSFSAFAAGGLGSLFLDHQGIFFYYTIVSLL
jgi:hypothetical protein